LGEKKKNRDVRQCSPKPRAVQPKWKGKKLSVMAGVGGRHSLGKLGLKGNKKTTKKNQERTNSEKRSLLEGKMSIMLPREGNCVTRTQTFQQEDEKERPPSLKEGFITPTRRNKQRRKPSVSARKTLRKRTGKKKKMNSVCKSRRFVSERIKRTCPNDGGQHTVLKRKKERQQIHDKERGKYNWTSAIQEEHRPSMSGVA